MKKAFDFVSHQSILVAAAHLGVPPPFLGYLRELYSNAQTRLRIGTELSYPIRLGQGVRQGDQISVHLFNAMIDLALTGWAWSEAWNGNWRCQSEPRRLHG